MKSTRQDLQIFRASQKIKLAREDELLKRSQEIDDDMLVKLDE